MRLWAAGRTSAVSFKGKTGDLREIGRTLGVSTVLEGSVRKAGNRLRITAQLVKVADGYHLWSERYDRELRDVFDIQDEMAQAIVAQLKGKLGAPSDRPLVKRYTENLEAHSLYLKGTSPAPQWRPTKSCPKLTRPSRSWKGTWSTDGTGPSRDSARRWR